jgi:hypothetical protein
MVFLEQKTLLREKVPMKKVEPKNSSFWERLREWIKKIFKKN